MKILSAKGYVPRIIKTLNEVIIKIACAGRFLILFSWFAPTYCDTMDEIALRVWPSTHISIDKKVVTIPTAAKASVALKSTFPTMAASVNDRIGSEIPEISAGIANLLICFRLMEVLIAIVFYNKKMGFDKKIILSFK